MMFFLILLFTFLVVICFTKSPQYCRFFFIAASTSIYLFIQFITLLLLNLSWHDIFRIFLQHHISKSFNFYILRFFKFQVCISYIRVANTENVTVYNSVSQDLCCKVFIHFPKSRLSLFDFSHDLTCVRPIVYSPDFTRNR